MLFFLEAEITDACLTTLGVIFFLRELLKIVFIIIPIGLILMISIDFFKGALSFEENPKVVNLVIKRLLYAIIIFLIPSSIFSFFNILEIDDGSSKSCWNYAGEVSVDEIRRIERTNIETSEANIEEMRYEILEKYRIKTTTQHLKTIVSVKSSYNSSSSDGEIVVGQKYNLSSSDLKALAYVAMREQGSPKGAAAEASLMANRFELYPKRGGCSNGHCKTLRTYVRDCGWFAGSKSRIDNPGNVPSKIMTAVKDALVNGNRTLALYVDEHDCWNCDSRYTCSNGIKGDICSITTNGSKQTSMSAIKTRNNYKKDETVIKNVFKAEYTFYCFPTESSDPFGYTAAAKKKIDGLNK